MMPDDPLAPAERPKLTFETVAVCLAIPAVALAYSFRFVSFLDAKNLVLSLFVATLAVLGLVHGRFPLWGLRRLLPLWILVGWTLAVHGALGGARVPAYTIESVVYGATVLGFAAYTLEAQRASGGRELVLHSFIV